MEKEKFAKFKDFVNSIPVVQLKNPYWTFDNEKELIISHLSMEKKTFDIRDWFELLRDVKTYFKQVFEDFGTEAQVLAVRRGDGKVLDKMQIPSLPNNYIIGDKEVKVYVLPQENSYGLTSISESFWQKSIIGNDISPLARIHSHHELDPYQSPTDYATLNSNTLEIVIGRVDKDLLSLGFWLDQRGQETKQNVWVYEERSSSQKRITCGKMRSKNNKFTTKLKTKKEND